MTKRIFVALFALWGLVATATATGGRDVRFFDAPYPQCLPCPDSLRS
jgi:hypothetical protein